MLKFLKTSIFSASFSHFKLSFWNYKINFWRWSWRFCWLCPKIFYFVFAIISKVCPAIWQQNQKRKKLYSKSLDIVVCVINYWFWKDTWKFKIETTFFFQKKRKNKIICSGTEKGGTHPFFHFTFTNKCLLILSKQNRIICPWGLIFFLMYKPKTTKKPRFKLKIQNMKINTKIGRFQLYFFKCPWQN